MPTWGVASGLIKDAQQEAAAMEKTGEEIRGVPFGSSRDTIFVSANRELVCGTDTFALNGTTYYVGLRR